MVATLYFNENMGHFNMTNGTRFDVITVECAGAPFSGNPCDYACFNEMIGKFDVYVFQNKTTNQVLYVGQAYKQNLKDRITQHYTKNDSGGTFRKNFCDTEEKSFQDFQILLNKSSIKAIAIDKESEILIDAIKSILISVLKPKYNK
jgi:predicted GIY-YIG superfamily endonuclease